MAPRLGHIFKPLRIRIDEKAIPEPNSGCFLWCGATNGAGYGTLTLGGHRRAYAHRVAYELDRGPIPDGMQLDHVCRNTLCVNPAHLEPVSNRDNTLRGRVSALRPPRLVCKRNHPLSETGYRDSRGSLQCRECHKIRYANYRVRKSNVHK